MTESRPRIAFLVNGGRESAMAERAESLARRMQQAFDIALIYRSGGKLTATLDMTRRAIRFAPDLCYSFDIAISGVTVAGLIYEATGTPFIVDTGDAIVPLGRALGRGRAGMLATEALESYSLKSAALVVVRGSYHQKLLAEQGIPSIHIPDGVQVEKFAPAVIPPQRDPARPLRIGLVGNSVWVPSRQMCYGSELVEMLRLLQGRTQRPVQGIMIGDGSGIAVLRERCRQYGLHERVEFAGRVPYDQLPARLQSFDICLSTQTNDVIGNVRTTGKLPIYLAAGRFVLASRAGEAARVLPPQMLVDFAGETDPGYPQKLADRVVELLDRGTDFSYRPECVALARRWFEYDVLADRLQAVLWQVLRPAGVAHT